MLAKGNRSTNEKAKMKNKNIESQSIWDMFHSSQRNVEHFAKMLPMYGRRVVRVMFNVNNSTL